MKKDNNDILAYNQKIEDGLGENNTKVELDVDKKNDIAYLVDYFDTKIDGLNHDIGILGIKIQEVYNLIDDYIYNKLK